MTAQPALSYDHLLRAVPVPNVAVRSERRGPGELVLHVPLRRRWFSAAPFSWLLPVSRERAVALDKMGAEVWEACDGRCRTRQIIRQFAGAHGLSFHEARVCVCAFLRMLMERNLVVMVGADGGEVGP